MRVMFYDFQMELGSSNEGSRDYLEEFAAKQPSCIISLRQYVATLSELKTTTTTSSEHRTTEYLSQPPLHNLGRNSSSLNSAAS